MDTNISEELAAFNFRVHFGTKDEGSKLFLKVQNGCGGK
jgi:hypothetical protein